MYTFFVSLDLLKIKVITGIYHRYKLKKLHSLSPLPWLGEAVVGGCPVLVSVTAVFDFEDSGVFEFLGKKTGWRARSSRRVS